MKAQDILRIIDNAKKDTDEYYEIKKDDPKFKQIFDDPKLKNDWWFSQFRNELLFGILEATPDQ